MRVELDDHVLIVTPAVPPQPAHVGVTVTNDSAVIEGYTALIRGIDEKWVASEPATLSLFPDESGRIELLITFPREFPAGRHLLIVEVSSRVPGGQFVHEELHVVVEPFSDAALAFDPPVRSVRRRAEFGVAVSNKGNTRIEVALSARDARHATRN